MELDAKPLWTSFPNPQPKLNIKKRRSTPSTTITPALTTTFLPNTPFASPYLNTSPTFPPSTAHNRCHICFRSQGITNLITECGICEKGMCQVCTRKCIVCEEERCSRCCVEESPSLATFRLMSRGENGAVCSVCLAEYKPSDDSGGGRSDDGIEMEKNGH